MSTQADAALAPVIVTENLTRHFGSVTAVDGLSVIIEPGEIFGFLGHNGAGKTTTVRLLNGVLAPSAGRALVLGFDPARDGHLLRRRTGVLTETPSLDDRLSARATLRIFADIYGIAVGQVDKRVDELLSLFDLSERGDDKVGGFSKGMRQRLALARTLLHAPELIFLDEPTAGLDPAATRDVHQLIVRASHEERHTVFLCTHNLVEAQRLCSRVAVLAQGKLLAVGAPSELAAAYGRKQRLLLELEAGQIGLARTIVTSHFPDSSVGQSENGQGHLSVQGIARTETPPLVNALTAAGVVIYQLVREEATLEDVYFALHGQ